MAVVYKISTQADNTCTDIYVYDRTGTYNAITNPNGWTAPNPDPVNAVESNLQVLYPGASVAVTIDTFPTLPTTSSTPFVLTPAMVSLGSFPDGRYDFISYAKITELAVDYEYWANATMYLLCGVRCCVDKMMANISTDRECCGNEKKVQRAMYAKTILDSITANVDAGDFDNADKLLKQLQDICNGIDCSCGTSLRSDNSAGRSGCGC